MTSVHALNGFAGLVESRRCRRTGTTVSLYHTAQAGIDTGLDDAGDPDHPWSTVCEEHSNLVCHRTRALARRHMAVPDEWCEDCHDPDPVVAYEVDIYYAGVLSINPIAPVVSLGPDRWQALNLGAQLFHTSSKSIDTRSITRSERQRLRETP